MVSFKSLIIAASLLTATVSAFPTTPNLNGGDTSIGSGTTSLVKRDDTVSIIGRDDTTSIVARDDATVDAGVGITKRTPGRQLLHWSPSGTVVYLLGTIGSDFAKLPPELLNMIQGHGQGGPAQILLYEFVTWIRDPIRRALYTDANSLLLLQHFGPGVSRVGGVFGVAQFANLWGFAFSFRNPPPPASLANLVSAIEAFGLQNGGRVGVFQRVNDFFNPTDIGAGLTRRGRTNTCPVRKDVLQYAVTDVPTDLDFKRYTRWSEICEGTPI